VCYASVSAQTARTITIRMLDSRTGHLIESSNFLIRADRKETLHADWVKENDDGSATLTLPSGVALVSTQATYDSSLNIYINCDSVKDKQPNAEHWYDVAQILSSGIVAPNGCSKKIATAKPGEFVFFVRKRNWKEELEQDYSQ
jgi:hypothetical protein